MPPKTTVPHTETAERCGKSCPVDSEVLFPVAAAVLPEMESLAIAPYERGSP